MDQHSVGQQTYRRGVAFSTAVGIVARGATFLTAIAIAYRFGTTDATDVYFYCYLLATLLAGLVATLDVMVVIPEIMHLRVKVGESAAMGFANTALYSYAAVALAVCAIAVLFPVALVGAGSRFSQATLEVNQTTIVLVLPLSLLMVVTQFLVDLLASHRYFALPMLSSAANNILALVAILAFGASVGLKVVPLALATGFLIQIVALGALLVRRFGWRFREVGFPRHGRMLSRVVYAQVASTAALIGASVPAYLISGLGPGLLTALQYGQRTAEIPHVILTNQFSSVAGIRFNDLAARHDDRRLNLVFLRSAQVLASALVPMAVLLSVYAPETVAILYSRGQFDSEAAAETSRFLSGLVLATPFLAVNALVSRLTMARQRVVAWSWFTIGLSAELSLWTFVVIERLGAGYYAAGVAVFYAVNSAALFAYMRWQHPEIMFGAALRTLGRLLIPTLAVTVLLLGSRMLLLSWPAWSRIAVGAGLYGAAILLFPRAFVMYPEARSALSRGTPGERVRRLLAVARG